jgi:hypothetical protein
MGRTRDVSKILTSNTSILTLASASTIYATNASMKKVVQIVYGSTTTGVTNTTSTYADTNLTATITPTSSSNKVLVIVSQNGCGKQSNNTSNNIRLMRGATEIASLENIGGYTNSTATVFFGSVSGSYLDSPATTSATTYKTQFRSETNNQQANVNFGSSLSTITLIEVTP